MEFIFTFLKLAWSWTVCTVIQTWVKTHPVQLWCFTYFRLCWLQFCFEVQSMQHGTIKNWDRVNSHFFCKSQAGSSAYQNDVLQHLTIQSNIPILIIVISILYKRFWEMTNGGFSFPSSFLRPSVFIGYVCCISRSFSFVLR